MPETAGSKNIGSETLRAFLAFALPGGVTASIEEIQRRLKSFDLRIRWVRPDGIHLTVKFLGDIRRKDLGKIEAACAGAVRGVKPISLRAEGVGVFPNSSRAKVLWAGMAGDTAGLSEVARRIEEAMLQVGFPKESRPFKGHLTLGRAKERIDPKRLSGALQSVSDFSSESFTADRLFLFQSELTPSGAVYTPLFEINFVQ